MVLNACVDPDERGSTSTIVIENRNDAPPPPACRPHAFLFSRQEPAHGDVGDAGDPTCTLDGKRRLIMSYNIDCSDRMEAGAGVGGQWQTCTFSYGDFSSFDPDEQGLGVVAARFCVDGDGGTVQGALNIWYDRGSHNRRYLSIVPPEKSLAPGCLTKFWSPEDSCFDVERCGKTDCEAQDGGCASSRRSDIQLTSEYCLKSSDATIVLESLVYYPQACLCDSDSDCPHPQVCRREGWWSDARCRHGSGVCPGVCAE
jgi:hypothetical protein